MDAGETSSSCYGGGDIAGAVLGTLIGGALLTYLLFWLYTNYWKNRKGTHLVTEDPENVKQEFAFDNAGFKGDNNKATGSTSPLDTKWNGVKQNSLEKRKAADDTQTGTPTPARLIALRGSDFTGLGIEICGGLKDGIFVKKVMPQGPAANIVRIGDKITSIKIDLRHMVQEDAATILSYASPYNVQLELIDGNGVLSYAPPANSPKSNGQRSLTHPLYRSSSQEDFNTIERNARKKYPTMHSDDANAATNNYPTLKMEATTKSTLPIVHRENEKKPAPKVIDDHVQTRSSVESNETEKKALKFGVRVLPISIGDAVQHTDRSPSKGQAENENNANVEADSTMVRRLSPPPISKRTKHNKAEEQPMHKVVPVQVPVVPSSSPPPIVSEFERQRSINSSGIRRDEAGIPQEIPNQMLAAAMAARDNRKSANMAAEIKKNKGKAPPRPATEDANDSIDTAADVVSSADTVDSSSVTRSLNFTDNFSSADLKTPPSVRKRHGSDTESQLTGYDQESDSETIKSGTQIELGSKHITVHQTSEEESTEDDDEQRRTASLGDLTLVGGGHEHGAAVNRGQNGTLERAQSLEMTEANNSCLNQKVTPKKRKAPAATAVEIDAEFNKEPRLMDLRSNLDTLQRSRLKSAYEWGNLEDAIYDTSNGPYAERSSDDDDEVGENFRVRRAAQKGDDVTSPDSSFVTHVMSVADKFDDKEVVTMDENVSRQMEQLNQERNEILSKVVEDSGTSVVVIQDVNVHDHKNPKGDAFHINWEPAAAIKRYQPLVDTDAPKSLENSINKFINSEKRNGGGNLTTDFDDDDDIDDNTPPPEYDFNYKPESVVEQRQPVSFQYMSPEPVPASDVRLITNTINTSTTNVNNVKEVPVGSSNRNHHNHHNSNDQSDQVKIINYGTNMPDDVKVSRYPLGSLEHLQAAVNTKLLAQQMALDEVNHRGVVTLNTSKTTIKPDVVTMQPPTSLPPAIGSPFASLLSGGSDSGDVAETPVFSSDGQGVNSISISSMEVNIRPDSRKSDNSLPAAAVLGLENVVTISTESGSSQPPSIILIDDERLDFTMRSMDTEATDSATAAAAALAKNEVFIIESLSSKKVPEPQTSPTNSEAKTFITEIRVQTPNEDDKSDDTGEKVQPPSPASSSPPSTPPKSFGSPVQVPQKKPSTDDEYGIPRNTEIRFTTATYESSSLQRPQYGGSSVIGNGRDSRSSQIDHIRSAFERNHSQSEIPVPVRKTSIPSLRTSPSKIPVFNSTKSGGGGDLSRKSSNGSIHSSNGSINNNSVSYSNNNVSPPNQQINNGSRVNVTVTSIKNSSRNPSGK